MRPGDSRPAVVLLVYCRPVYNLQPAALVPRSSGIKVFVLMFCENCCAHIGCAAPSLEYSLQTSARMPCKSPDTWQLPDRRVHSKTMAVVYHEHGTWPLAFSSGRVVSACAYSVRLTYPWDDNFSC